MKGTRLQTFRHIGSCTGDVFAYRLRISTHPKQPRFGVQEARAVKLAPRDAVHDPRLKVREPRTYVLGPWPSDHGPGFRQGCR